MGFIAKIFETIANIIHKIITGIADAITWIGKKIAEFMDGIGKWIVLGGFLLVFFAPGLMGALLAGVKTVVSSIGSFVWNAGKWVISKIVTSIQWLGGTFQSFLQAIHFKELLTLHKMAMLLSKDYRIMMLGVYKEISEFSYQVFGTTETLHLLLQGSRQLIYSMSSAVGYPTDIAEVEWLQTLDETLQRVANKAEHYSDSPESIFDDLAQWVYEPLGDKYSTINQGFVLALESVIGGVDAVAQTVFEINEQTQQVVSYLPEPLRGTLQDTLDPIDQRISHFQYDLYEPKMAELDEALHTTNDNVYTNKQEIGGLTRRLINPVEYLGELDKLDAPERDEDKRRLDISLNEPFDTDRKQLSEGIDREVEIEIEEKPKIPEPKSEPPEFMELEPEKITPPARVTRIGWNVGDY